MSSDGASPQGPHYLFVLVGPTAIGKTYWSNILLARYAGKLKRVKNTTTRPPRDQHDFDSYNFISHDEFVRGITEQRFLEYDQVLGQYYGSSFEEITKTLQDTSGIFAITPSGAIALYGYRHQINITNVVLKPASHDVLFDNYARRGIINHQKQAELLVAAKDFVLPPEIEHTVVTITGNEDVDKKNLVRIIEPKINPQ